MGCLNFTKKGDVFTFVSKEYGEFKGKGKKQLHWVTKENVPIKIKTDDNADIDALAEPGVSDVKPDQMIQFERFGFCRCDKENSFWFTHR